MSISSNQLLEQKKHQKVGKGILTLAHGKPRYLNMAKVLAMSLQLHSNEIPRAVITDSSDPDLRRLYPIHIPLKPEFGAGVQQKIYLDQYSPFEETLFIDSDCIVVNNINSLWDIFSGVSFGVVGGQVHDGYWFMDISKICSNFGLNSIPQFNSGLCYFKNNDQVKAIYQTAREILQNYNQLGLGQFRGGQADEPIFAIALAKHGVCAIGDGGSTMRTPIGICGPLKIDVLEGFCRFNKEGVCVSPAIVHFCGDFAKGFYYKRERLKLYLATRSRRLNYFISLLVNAIFYPPHTVYQGLRSVYKALKTIPFKM